jgi:hypothetical protein
MHFTNRDDVSKTNIGDSYINYQPDQYDDGYDSWQNTQSPFMNDNKMTNEQGDYASYQRQSF